MRGLLVVGITKIFYALFLIFASSLSANECKVWIEPRTVTKEISPQSKDWSWSCNMSGSLNGSIFNSTDKFINKIVITGTTSGNSVGENVFPSIRPNTSHNFFFLSGNGICGKNKSARMKLEYRVNLRGYCKTKFTPYEMEANRKKDQELQRIRKDQAVKKKNQNILYNNCVIAKSKGINKSAVASVRSICNEISINPSVWQKFKGGP